MHLINASLMSVCVSAALEHAVVHDILFTCFADDIQIYLPVKTYHQASVQALINCVSDICSWMNKNKAEIILFRQQNILDGYDSAIGTLNSYCHGFAKVLGVVLDSELKFDRQIRSIVKTSVFELRLLAKVKNYLPKQALERAIHCFVISQQVLISWT